jgi:hypothetical protein
VVLVVVLLLLLLLLLLVELLLGAACGRQIAAAGRSRPTQPWAFSRADRCR